jgi:putative transposase
MRRNHRACAWRQWLQYFWYSIEEVQDFSMQWMWSYNHDRPNMALDGFTPKKYLAMAA